jgi:raffinose/stachyose/melibiose transport system permease protein
MKKQNKNTGKGQVAYKGDLLKRFKLSIPVYLLLLPTLILFFTMGIYPIIWALKYCLYNYDGTTIPVFVGLDNFKKIFDFKEMAANPSSHFLLYWKSWGRTLSYAVIKTAIEVPIAFLCALFITQEIKGSKFFKTLFYLPQILPSFAIFMVMGIMLNPFNGILTKQLADLGLITQHASLLADGNLAFMVGIIADVWFYFGLNMLLFIAGLTSIPKDIYESAKVDGVSPFQELKFITLPMMGRMGQIIIMLSLVGCLKALGSYFIMTKGGPNHSTELTFLYIYNLFFPSNTTAQYGLGAAVAVVSAVIVSIITFIYMRVSEKLQYD